VVTKHASLMRLAIHSSRKKCYSTGRRCVYSILILLQIEEINDDGDEIGYFKNFNLSFFSFKNV